jgi:hypothetical protein
MNQWESVLSKQRPELILSYFFNQIVLFFEELLVFIAWEWKSFKGFNQKFWNHQRSIIGIQEFIIAFKILLNFGVISEKFLDFSFDDGIDFLFTFFDKLTKDRHNFFEVLLLFWEGPLFVIVKDFEKVVECWFVVIKKRRGYHLRRGVTVTVGFIK